MKLSQKYINLFLYIVAIFAAVYSTKYLIDAIAYSIINLGSLCRNITHIAGKILQIFAIVLLGFVIAYIFDPAVSALQKRLHLKRFTATTLLYLLFISTILIVFLIVIQKIYIYDQNSLTNAFYLAYTHYKAQLMTLYKNFFATLVRYDFFNLLSTLAEIAEGFKFNYLHTIQRIGKFVVNGFISLVIAFYFLKDKQKILYTLNHNFRILLPKQLYIIIIRTLSDIDSILSGYIRGQLTDAVIMTILISSSLSLLNIPFAVLIGIVSGFSNVIPYFGAIIGLLLSVVTALLSHGIGKAALTVLVMLLLQQIDSLVIVPKIVGERVKLSPVVVIIALGIAGNLFGFWGMVFAVPVAALIKVFGNKALKYTAKKRRI